MLRTLLFIAAVALSASGIAARGGRPAAIFLCENTDANNGVTIDNTIEDNAASSYCGILLIGAARVRPYLVPRFNVLRGNNVYDSVVGCADAFRPGQWPDGRNTWAGNKCAGQPNTGPAYF